MVYVQVTTYRTFNALTRDSLRTAEGTLAYVSERGGELYIRARNGWRKIQVFVSESDICCISVFFSGFHQYYSNCQLDVNINSNTLFKSNKKHI